MAAAFATRMRVVEFAVGEKIHKGVGTFLPSSIFSTLRLAVMLFGVAAATYGMF